MEVCGGWAYPQNARYAAVRDLVQWMASLLVMQVK
jgi:hypothetical protein